MADPREVLAQRVQVALAASFGTEHASADPAIRPSAFADFQANVALPLAKRLARSPRDVATEIAGHVHLDDVCDKIDVSGPGFINFTLRGEWVAGQAAELLTDPRLGVPAADPARKTVVDYSAPNVAKEMHVGHLRTTVVGDAVVRILEHLGHLVVRANHLGDWGTPFGMLIEHLLDVGEEAARLQLSAGEITAFYQADHLVVMDIYAAGEEPIPGVEAKSLAEGIAGHGHKAVHYCADRDAAVTHLMEAVRPGDMVITLGAGNVWQVGEQLANHFRQGGTA